MPGVRFVSLPPAARRLAGPSSAVIFVAAATVTRVWLGRHLPGLTIFSLYYPAILGAAFIGGGVSAALALLLGAAAVSWFALHDALGLSVTMSMVTLNLAIFLLTGAFIGAVGARLRLLLRRRRADIARLAEREARYRVLFEDVAEGFALVEGIWGEDGRLLDYIVEDANPALRAMFKDVPIVGRRRSEFGEDVDPDLLPACERALRGSPTRLELFSKHAGLWFDVRMSRVAGNKLAQIVVDITERKAAEQRRTEMFDELNHRVKNNLAAVSAMLSMQARAVDDRRVREQLQKAVDRIEAIGDVHASLYRASSADEVDFTAYLQRLCERLSTSLVDGERVRLEVEADPMMAPLDEAVALGLIVNELVTNAAKYAYPAPASGVIHVALHNRPGELLLKVSDEGQGLAGSANGPGIGMRLVRSLVEQCRGELTVAPGPGASFVVRLPEPPRPP